MILTFHVPLLVKRQVLCDIDSLLSRIIQKNIGKSWYRPGTDLNQLWKPRQMEKLELSVLLRRSHFLYFPEFFEL